MRVYRRDEFLDLPPGTLYCKGKPWYFGGLSVKYDTLHGGSGDFVARGLEWIEAHTPDEADRRFQEMLEAGASYPLDDAAGRDGYFDDDDLFLVYEPADLLELRRVIDAALTAAAPAKEET